MPAVNYSACMCAIEERGSRLEGNEYMLYFRGIYAATVKYIPCQVLSGPDQAPNKYFQNIPSNLNATFWRLGSQNADVTVVAA